MFQPVIVVCTGSGNHANEKPPLHKLEEKDCSELRCADPSHNHNLRAILSGGMFLRWGNWLRGKKQIIGLYSQSLCHITATIITLKTTAFWFVESIPLDSSHSFSTFLPNISLLSRAASAGRHEARLSTRPADDPSIGETGALETSLAR